MTRRAYKDLTGMKFGKLKVIKRVDDTYRKDGSPVIMWECKCDCGNPNNIIVKGGNLKNKQVKSCGCLAKEVNTKIKNKEKRLGEINYNKYGSKMKIVEYNNAIDIIVEFENGFKIKTAYKCFKKGEVTNLYDKSVYSVGCIGEGKHKTKINKIQVRSYKIWKSMLQRCYNKERQEKFPTYKGCTVCKEWLNYQIFADWYDENYYEIENERISLDKDILYKGNKIYSSNTCIFTPQRINTLFLKRGNDRGEYPLGVFYDKSCKKYCTSCSTIKNNKTKEKFLGYYPTPEEAFYTYKEFKEKYIKQVADEYKNKYPQFPQKLYDAMYTYEVEITD